MKPWQFIEVHWVDSVRSHTDWSHADDWESKPLPIIRTAGYLREETKDSISLCQSRDSISPDEGEFLFVITIPKSCVKKIRKL